MTVPRAPPPSERASAYAHTVKLWASAWQEFDDWFRVLDMDRSGTIEEYEVRRLMASLGVEPTAEQMASMFGAVNREVGDSLDRSCFVRFMIANLPLLSGSAFVSTSGQLLDANTRLMMLAYRRSRAIEDVADPEKRWHFRSPEAFERQYGRTLRRDARADGDAHADGGTGARPPAPRTLRPHRPAHDRQTGGGVTARTPRLPAILPSPRPPSYSLASPMPPISPTAPAAPMQAPMQALEHGSPPADSGEGTHSHLPDAATHIGTPMWPDDGIDSSQASARGHAPPHSSVLLPMASATAPTVV